MRTQLTGLSLYEGKIMAVSTTPRIWRSGGGDQTRTAYCGTGLMVAQFYFSATATAGNKVTVSSSDSSNVILPAGAVIVQINANAAATGGTDPTFDMGYTLYTSGTATNAGLLNEADADAGKQVFTWATATVPGAGLGAVMSATQMVYITGNVGASAATGGAVSGQILYYVTDPYLGQQNV
jgi:hypothetical protein